MAGKNLDYNFLLDCNFDLASACSSAADYYILVAADRPNSAAGCNFVGILDLDCIVAMDRTTAQRDHNIHLAAAAVDNLEGRYSTDLSVREMVMEVHDHDRDCGSYELISCASVPLEINMGEHVPIL